MITQPKTYDTRNTEYKKVHSIPDDLYIKVIDSLELFPEAFFADFMAGHGEVSNAVLKYCRCNNISIKGAMLDAYGSQLPYKHQFSTVIGDIRNDIFLPNSVDRTIVKQGIHELPQKDQQIAIYQIYKALKPEGKAIFWELGLADRQEQQTFQQIVRKKDELAGFDDLVKNRYFCMETELQTYFETSGFSKIEVIHRGIFNLNTAKWLDNDFTNNYNKLEKLNDYILGLPQNEIQKYNFKMIDDNISMEFNWPIFKATK